MKYCVSAKNMENKEVFVNISPDIKYPIIIGDYGFDELKEMILQQVQTKRLFIVISKKVNDLYGKELNFANSIKYILKDGEKEKNFKNYQKIINFALKNQIERKDTIVAIGGGVVGDIAGFVAATYLRGIDFIQIPTTLLACVDSSIGGKVAINTDYGKNLVGAFYQPKAVFCNLNFLKTLDERQFKTGLAEVLKYAFIEKSCLAPSEYNFFDFLSHNSTLILQREFQILASIIEISIKLKVAVVSRDEKELGLRKILNFGHTYGHAVERITNYSKYTHGEAVAIGIGFAINLAFEKGLITGEFRKEAMDLVDKYSIVKKIPSFNIQDINKAMGLDKKVETGKIKFVLPVSKSYVEIFDYD